MKYNFSQVLTCHFLISGSQNLPFSTSYVYPSTIILNHSRFGISNTETDARLQPTHFPDEHNGYLGSSSNDSVYKIGKQDIFLQSDNPESSVCQPLVKTIDFSENGGGRGKMLYNKFTSPGHESDCALSLLSSLQTQSSGIGLSQAEQDRNLISFLQPVDVSLGHPNSLEQVNSVLNGSVNTADISCSGMFHIASEDGGKEAPPASLPFHHWH